MDQYLSSNGKSVHKKYVLKNYEKGYGIKRE